MSVAFLDLAKQYQSIEAEINEVINAVITSANFIGGQYVSQFEQQFAAFIGDTDTKNIDCVGVANGTDALEIAIQALQLPSGGEIIVPANSFIATAEAVTRQGHRVVFCDVNPDTYLIDVDTIKAKISQRTVAIIAVHLYGQPCNMPAIAELAQQYGIKLIEDAAQAHAAKFNNEPIGYLSDVACFSFYPGKNLGAYGDAGAIISNHESLIKTCRMLANHGRIDKYNHEFVGRNSRLDALQAAVLSVKLKHLPEWTSIRQQRAISYLQRLQPLQQQGHLQLPKIASGAECVWHLFVIRTSQRDALKAYLAAQGIATGIHYPIALPHLPAYAHLRQAHEIGFAWQSAGQLLSLPMGDHLSDQDVEKVCIAVADFFHD